MKLSNFKMANFKFSKKKTITKARNTVIIDNIQGYNDAKVLN